MIKIYETDDPMTFGVGTVSMAAEALCDLANQRGKTQHAEFNGTPMKAYPGELPLSVVDRWKLEHEAYQRSIGITPL